MENARALSINCGSVSFQEEASQLGKSITRWSPQLSLLCEASLLRGLHLG